METLWSLSMSIQVGVGAIVLRRRLQGGLELLLVQRLKDPGKGSWAVPGGRMKFGETLSSCAEREVLEETGLRVRAENRACYGFSIRVSDDLQYVVVDVKAELMDEQAEPVAADDAGGAEFFSREAFEKIGHVNEETKKLVSVLRLFE